MRGSVLLARKGSRAGRGVHMNLVMNFMRDLAMQSVAVQIWAVWMLVAIFAVPCVLLKYESSRRAAKLILVSSVALCVLMLLWHSQVGYTRILGLPHLLVWVPLLVYLYARQDRLVSPWQVRWLTNALVLTLVISLGLDTADIVRYILGERAPMVPAG